LQILIDKAWPKEKSSTYVAGHVQIANVDIRYVILPSTVYDIGAKERYYSAAGNLESSALLRDKYA